MMNWVQFWTLMLFIQDVTEYEYIIQNKLIIYTYRYE